jgi:hypothetical protein
MGSCCGSAALAACLARGRGSFDERMSTDHETRSLAGVGWQALLTLALVFVMVVVPVRDDLPPAAAVVGTMHHGHQIMNS